MKFLERQHRLDAWDGRGPAPPPPDRPHARGSLWADDGRARANFTWHDVESGERLVVEASGSEEFLRELESLGFERSVEARVVDPSRLAGRSQPRGPAA